MGSPFVLSFTDPDELQEQVDAYFASLTVQRIIQGRDGSVHYEDVQLPPTLGNLAVHLDVTYRTLRNYLDRPEDDPISHVLARAHSRIIAWNEIAAYERETFPGAQLVLLRTIYRDDDGDGAGEGFEVKVIAPAGPDQVKAIPKWEPESGTE